MSPRLSHVIRMVVLAAMVGGTLAACGKRGPPDPPPGDPNTYPRSYPIDRG